jgi:hypothetical protein
MFNRGRSFLAQKYVLFHDNTIISKEKIMQKQLFIKYFIIIVILCPTILFGQTDPVPQKQTIEMELLEDSDISEITGYGNCQWLWPLDEPNDTLLQQPEYKSKKPYFYAAKYGDAKDNIHTIVLDESKGTGKGYDTVYVDLDNDNRISSDNEKFQFQMSTTRNEIPLRIKLTISAGGKKIPYYFNFTAFPYTDKNNPVEKIHANARNSSIFTGHANLDGKDYKIGIADLNSNGLFNDIEQGIFRGDRFFVDFDGDGKFHDSPTDLVESFSYGKYTKIMKQWYSIKTSADGTSIQISPAQPKMGTLLAPENIISADLHSDTQSQPVKFSEGSAQAIAGTFDLATIRLSAIDSSNRTWTTRGVFRSNKPTVTIEPGSEARMKNPLPLQVSIEPAGKSPSDAVKLEVKITGINGAGFSPPRAERPEGSFEIKDAEGNVVASDKFEYG